MKLSGSRNSVDGLNTMLSLNLSLIYDRRMIKVGDIVKIEALDYLIISETGFLSMIDRDLAEYKEMKLEIELELAEKKKSLEIAKSMKKDGLDIDIIKKKILCAQTHHTPTRRFYYFSFLPILVSQIDCGKLVLF